MIPKACQACGGTRPLPRYHSTGKAAAERRAFLCSGCNAVILRAWDSLGACQAKPDREFIEFENLRIEVIRNLALVERMYERGAS